MNRIVITGGAGFVGSHIVEHVREVFLDSDVVVLDKMTYAADFRNIEDLLVKNQINLVVGDICDYELCRRVVRRADLVIHAAAESHVDNSFEHSRLFTRTNVFGSHTLMEACRNEGVPRIIHIGTDEVYGEILRGECDESAALNPTNPYSASKAAAEMIIHGYINSFKLPVIRVRANNIFGIRQYPEKIIPKFCLSLIEGKKIPLHGDGQNNRHYLAIQDFAEAVVLLAKKGTIGRVYNAGSDEEYTNVQVASMICHEFGKNVQNEIEFVPDRPFNDRRYRISSAKIRSLGWQPRRRLKTEIGSVVGWYRENAERYLTGAKINVYS